MSPLTWQAPAWLWLLLALPALALALVAWGRAGPRAAAAYADPRVLRVGPSRRARGLRGVAAGLALLAVAAGLVALARPSVAADSEARQSSVVIAIDLSQSMLKDDLAPTRLAAAVDAAERFLDEAPEDAAVGLVTFSDRARVVVAPERERTRTRAALMALGETREGTALGEAVDVALVALQTSGALDPPPASAAESPARVLVLTDGANSIRRALSPGQAAERAAALGVPIYTILLGDDPGRPDQPLPAETLAAMSTRTGGISAQSSTSADLARVFADIGSFLAPETELRDLSAYVAGAALGLLGAAAVLGALARPRAVRGPEAHPV